MRMCPDSESPILLYSLDVSGGKPRNECSLYTLKIV